MARKAVSGAILLLLVSSLAGCHLFFASAGVHKPVPHFIAPRETAVLRRVLVLPFFIESGGGVEPDFVTKIFVRELQKTGRFEVLPLPDDSLEKWLDNYPRRTSRFKVDKLLKFSRSFNVDAVIFATITRFKAYKPPVLGITVKMMTTGTGRSVWESEVLYDMHDKRDVEDLRHYLGINREEDESYHGSFGLTLNSPRLFTTYVCNRLTELWPKADLEYR